MSGLPCYEIQERLMEKETAEKIKELEERIAALEKAQTKLQNHFFRPPVPRIIDLPEEMKAKPLSELNLKDYTVQRLAAQNFTTLGDFAGYSKSDMFNVEKLGKKVIYDLTALYEMLGISFHYDLKIQKRASEFE